MGFNRSHRTYWSYRTYGNLPPCRFAWPPRSGGAIIAKSSPPGEIACRLEPRLAVGRARRRYRRADPRFRRPAAEAAKDQDYELVELVVEVLSEVDQKYIHELTPEQKRKLVSDMINGGLERLDPYSEFYDAEDYARFDKDTRANSAGSASSSRRTARPARGWSPAPSPAPPL